MSPAASINAAIDAFGRALSHGKSLRVFAGADGFIDEIIQVVDKRFDETNYSPVRTITDYARRLGEAAGKSTNVEFVVTQVKLGGNGPIMAEGLGRLGCHVRYVGSLGWPDPDPIFATLAQYGPVTSLCPPGITLAAEFEDGKIMHGKHETLKQVTWENLVARLGGMDRIDAILAESDLVALVNWTMLPYFTDVFEGIRRRLDVLGPDRSPRLFFFDLADPAKRTPESIAKVCHTIGTFNSPGRTVVLGLNEKESLEVCAALKLEAGPSDAEGLIHRAERIARATSIDEVMIHPTHSAAAWNKDATGATDGPFCAAPKLTTGAGDHFNAGYMFSRAVGLSPQHSLVIGKCVSGFYVREGRGPSAAEIAAFGQRWAEGRLDPWTRP